MQFINLILRAAGVVFAAVVLGLSGNLYHTEYSHTSYINYTLFAGAWAMLAALIGIAIAILDKFAVTLVMIVIDALSALIQLAAGIALAAKLGVHSCSIGSGGLNVDSYQLNNDIISGGAVYLDPSNNELYYLSNGYYEKRCREAQADTAFLWFGFAVAVGCIAAGFFARASK